MFLACRLPAGTDARALAVRAANSLGLFDRVPAPHRSVGDWIVSQNRPRALSSPAPTGRAKPLNPAVGADGSVVLFEGYWDNPDALAEQLHRPAGDLVALYAAAVERWGDRADERLIGNYATIIAWPDGRLRLARSPWNAPPLMFCNQDGVLAAASIARVLHACGLPREVNRQRVADNLYFNLNAPEGWFRGIERVRRGEIVHLAANSRRQVKFYDELKR